VNQLTVNQLSELKGYISASHMNSLHEKSFLETINKLLEFTSKGRIIEKDRVDYMGEDSYLSWVLNSAPGTGKSTALNTICKMMLKVKGDSERIPLLLVFNNNDTMKNNIYNDVFQFAKKNDIPNAITYITDETVEEMMDQMYRFQILCIPQQRFRDLKLGHGNLRNYLNYTPQRLKDKYDSEIYEAPKPSKRLIIIDEMPIFYNPSVWDITSEDNSFDWYEKLAYSAELNTREFKDGRDILSELINFELKENMMLNANLKLKRLIEYTEKEQYFNSILNKFADVTGELDDIRRYKWFMKLYHDDNIGCIERDNKQVIICSEWLDYREFETSILILDGTALINKSIYLRSGFELVPLVNHHRYSERLTIHWKNINTSMKRMKYADQKEVKEAIVGDYLEIMKHLTVQNPDFKMIALPKKKDISFYYSAGVITDEQYKQFYTDRQKIEDDMMKHLFNLIGNNDFSIYNAMALFGIPIRPPRHYREIAVAIYGVDIDLSLNQDRNKGDWFNDKKVQAIYEETVLAELSQIIHRTSLRNINAQNEIDIIVYSNRTEWLIKLQKEFRLPNSRVLLHQLHNELRFKKTCIKKIAEMVKGMIGKKNMDITVQQIGGKKLYQWFNDNWKSGKRRLEILNELQRNNILLFEKVSQTGRKYWLFRLVDLAAFTDYEVEKHYKKIS
jgi:hypothetical protein